MKKYFKVGDIVKYSENWCREEERHLIHIVREDRSCEDEKFNRYLIETLNGRKYLGYLNSIEDVFDYMIEPVNN